MDVEVLFVTTVRVAGHKAPDIVTYKDGVLVRSLLKGGHAVLIDPPHLPGYNDYELPEELVEEPIKEVVNESLDKNGSHSQPIKPKTVQRYKRT